MLTLATRSLERLWLYIAPHRSSFRSISLSTHLLRPLRLCPDRTSLLSFSQCLTDLFIEITHLCGSVECALFAHALPYHAEVKDNIGSTMQAALGFERQYRMRPGVDQR